MAHGYLLLLLHVPKGQPCSMPRGSIHICVGQPCFMLGWWHPGPHGSEPCSMPGLWHPHSCESDLFRAGVTASQSPRVTALLRPLSQPEITSVPWLDLGIWAGAQDVLGQAAGAQGCREGPAGATECWWLQLGWGWARWCLGLGQGPCGPPSPTGLCPTGGLSLVGPHGARGVRTVPLPAPREALGGSGGEGGC